MLVRLDHVASRVVNANHCIITFVIGVWRANEAEFTCCGLGVTSDSILRSKKSGVREHSRNDPSDQSLPKMRNRNPGRRA
jgi:hypothetical protein